MTSVVAELTGLRTQILALADAWRDQNPELATTLVCIVDALGSISWAAAMDAVQLGQLPNSIAPLLPSVLLHTQHSTLQ